jgi:hypothetical protein
VAALGAKVAVRTRVSVGAGAPGRIPGSMSASACSSSDMTMHSTSARFCVAGVKIAAVLVEMDIVAGYRRGLNLCAEKASALRVFASGSRRVRGMGWRRGTERISSRNGGLRL